MGDGVVAAASQPAIERIQWTRRRRRSSGQSSRDGVVGESVREGEREREGVCVWLRETADVVVHGWREQTLRFSRNAGTRAPAAGAAALAVDPLIVRSSRSSRGGDDGGCGGSSSDDGSLTRHTHTCN